MLQYLKIGGFWSYVKKKLFVSYNHHLWCLPNYAKTKKNCRIERKGFISGTITHPNCCVRYKMIDTFSVSLSKTPVRLSGITDF